MKLYVPELGDQIKLTSDWSFKLISEHRNTTLIDYFFGESYWKKNALHGDKLLDATLPKDTILTIDRVYIRKGATDYSSITFRTDLLNKKSIRFFAKLDDCNKIEFEHVKTINDKERQIKKRLQALHIDLGYHYIGSHWKFAADDDDRPSEYFITGSAYYYENYTHNQVFDIQIVISVTWEKETYSKIIEIVKGVKYRAIISAITYVVSEKDSKVVLGKYVKQITAKAAIKKLYKEKLNSEL